jgi:hypothetical protein
MLKALVAEKINGLTVLAMIDARVAGVRTQWIDIAKVLEAETCQF